MKLLKDRILKDGVVKPGNILKVDSFLNHQMDITLINEIGKERIRRAAKKIAEENPETKFDGGFRVLKVLPQLSVLALLA